MSNNCEACGATAELSQRFCEIHQLAYNNLKDAYDKWRSAHSEQLQEMDFLKRVLSIDETGRAASEVASLLIRRGGGLE